jgi:hypothetical protein
MWCGMRLKLSLGRGKRNDRQEGGAAVGRGKKQLHQE